MQRWVQVQWGIYTIGSHAMHLSVNVLKFMKAQKLKVQFSWQVNNKYQHMPLYPCQELFHPACFLVSWKTMVKCWLIGQRTREFVFGAHPGFCITFRKNLCFVKVLLKIRYDQVSSYEYLSACIHIFSILRCVFSSQFKCSVKLHLKHLMILGTCSLSNV